VPDFAVSRQRKRCLRFRDRDNTPPRSAARALSVYDLAPFLWIRKCDLFIPRECADHPEKKKDAVGLTLTIHAPFARQAAWALAALYLVRMKSAVFSSPYYV